MSRQVTALNKAVQAIKLAKARVSSDIKAIKRAEAKVSKFAQNSYEDAEALLKSKMEELVESTWNSYKNAEDEYDADNILSDFTSQAKDIFEQMGNTASEMPELNEVYIEDQVDGLVIGPMGADQARRVSKYLTEQNGSPQEISKEEASSAANKVSLRDFLKEMRSVSKA